MGAYDNNAQPQPKQANEYVAHQYHVNAHFNAEKTAITVDVGDAVTKKKWQLILVKENYADIQSTYDQIKAVLESSQMAVTFPDEGKPLDLLLKTSPEYMELELPEIK